MSDPLIDNLSYISSDPVTLKECCFHDDDLSLQNFSWYHTACISMDGISRRIAYPYKYDTRGYEGDLILKAIRRDIDVSYKQRGGFLWDVSKNTN